MKNVVFAVITKVPNAINEDGTSNTGNIATDFYYKAKDNELFIISENVPNNIEAISDCYTEVFQAGELLICSKDTEREIPYPSRKPSKWNVEYEVFDDLELAIIRCKEVIDMICKRS